DRLQRPAPHAGGVGGPPDVGVRRRRRGLPLARGHVRPSRGRDAARDRRPRADAGVPLRRGRGGYPVPPRGGPGGDLAVGEDPRRRRRAGGGHDARVDGGRDRPLHRRTRGAGTGIVPAFLGRRPSRGVTSPPHHDLVQPPPRVYDRRTELGRGGVMADLNVVSFRPERSDYAWTFGGVEPVMKVKPGDVLEGWTEDCFAGLVQTVDDLPSEKITAFNPQTGPFYVEGAEPGATRDLHFL